MFSCETWPTQVDNGCHFMLNDRELGVVKQYDSAYRKRYKTDPGNDKELIYFLGDNPSYSLTWSAHSKRIPCFRRNKGFYLKRSSWTIMTPGEKLTALGWPTLPELAKKMLCTPLQTLDSKRGELMAGNAMHLGNAAIVLAIGLACFRKVPESEIQK